MMKKKNLTVCMYIAGPSSPCPSTEADLPPGGYRRLSDVTCGQTHTAITYRQKYRGKYRTSNTARWVTWWVVQVVTWGWYNTVKKSLRLWMPIQIYLYGHPELSGFLSIQIFQIYPDIYPERSGIFLAFLNSTKNYIAGNFLTIQFYLDDHPVLSRWLSVG